MMSDTAQASSRGQAPTTGARRGPATVLVGDQVGRPGGDAARAVRRAGMRPALDRSFGHGPAETGLVVEQDPPAGTQVSRNAMVTLYVAAPSPRAPADGPSEPDRAPPGEGQSRDEPRDSVRPAEDGTAGPRVRRVPVAGALEDGLGQPLGAIAFPAEEPTDVLEPMGELFRDPFAADAEAAPGVRRVYPRRPMRLALANARRWLWRLGIAGLAALLIAATLSGHPSPKGPARPLAAAPATHPAPAGEGARPASPRRRRRARIPRQSRTDGRPLRRSRGPTPRPSTAAPAASTRASTPAPTSTGTRTAGGPFSP